MALDEDLVAAARVVLAAEEVVEAGLVERGRRRVGGDVTAHADAGALRAVDGDSRVPAEPATIAPLEIVSVPPPVMPVCPAELIVSRITNALIVFAEPSVKIVSVTLTLSVAAAVIGLVA